jgi:rubrerythrin
MAQQAKEEGFADIAFLFQSIGKIEKAHQERYAKLLAELEAETIFKQEESARWRCRKCGHIHEGLAAPNVCPVCKHPQAYFELVEEHY